MRLVYFGTPDFSAEFLQALFADSAFDIVGVVAQPDEPVGRKKTLTAPPTKVLAQEQHVPVLQPTKLKDAAFQQALRDLQADVFVVVAYGRMIPQAVLDMPKFGCINVHPSLLPKFRGPSPMQAAIAQRCSETGVTIMRLDADMDHGPVLAQHTIALPNDATYEWLTMKAVEVGAPLLITTLKNISTITPREQDHESATFCKLLTREDGKIDWHSPAEVIDAQIRAYNPWPGTSTTWTRDGQATTLKIFKSRPSTMRMSPGTVKIDGDRLLVGTATTALIVDELQPATGKRMPAAAFVRGYGDIDGTTLG